MERPTSSSTSSISSLGCDTWTNPNALHQAFDSLAGACLYAIDEDEHIIEDEDDDDEWEINDEEEIIGEGIDEEVDDEEVEVADDEEEDTDDNKITNDDVFLILSSPGLPGGEDDDDGKGIYIDEDIREEELVDNGLSDDEIENL